MNRRVVATVIAVTTILAVGTAGAAPPGQDGAFNFRIGKFVPSKSGDFWTAKEAAFKLEHEDSVGGIGGVGYTASISNYFEFEVNVDFNSQSARWSDPDFVDQYGDLILHKTTLSIVPVTFGFRVLPWGRFLRRGEAGKRLVRHPVPYFGAGIGGTYWQYEERGDFRASDLSIVYDSLEVSGFAFEKHAELGIEFPVAPDWNITLEVRRSWAEATPGDASAVVNRGTLDLGGASAFLGASVRF